MRTKRILLASELFLNVPTMMNVLWSWRRWRQVTAACVIRSLFAKAGALGEARLRARIALECVLGGDWRAADL